MYSSTSLSQSFRDHSKISIYLNIRDKLTYFNRLVGINTLLRKSIVFKLFKFELPGFICIGLKLQLH